MTSRQRGWAGSHQSWGWRRGVGKEHGTNIGSKMKTSCHWGIRRSRPGRRIPARLETKIEWIDLFTSARHRAPVVWRAEGMADCPPIAPWPALRGEKLAFRVRAASVDGDALMVVSTVVCCEYRDWAALMEELPKYTRSALPRLSHDRLLRPLRGRPAKVLLGTPEPPFQRLPTAVTNGAKIFSDYSAGFHPTAQSGRTHTLTENAHTPRVARTSYGPASQ